jgi:hypothetical protein
MCFQFDPGQVKIDEPVIIEIAGGNKILARWKAGKQRASADPIKIIFDRESFRLLDQRKAGFELRILTEEGKILQKRNIRLVTR